MRPELLHAVVFDLDGTLTHGGHDFAAIKRRLGLDPSTPLTEGLMALAEPRRSRAWAEVEAWEEELAEVAVADPAAHSLLAALQARDVRLGVLTRNTRATALRSLAVAGLADFFDPDHVIGRHEATPKPDPEGLWLLLRAWSVQPHHALMVGDAPHDTATGLAIGAFAVGVDPYGRRNFGAVHAVVRDLAQLSAILGHA